jgi:hypothetical protein
MRLLHNAQGACCCHFWAQFDTTIVRRSGRAHRNADAMSRRPCERAGSCSQCRRRFGCDVISASCEHKNQNLLVAAVTRSQARQRREVASTSSDNRDVVDVCPVGRPGSVNS